RRPGFLRLTLHRGEIAREPVAFVFGALELGLKLRFLSLQTFGGGGVAAVKLSDGASQISFGLGGGFETRMLVPKLDLALSQQARLLGKPVLEIMGAAA